VQIIDRQNPLQHRANKRSSCERAVSELFARADVKIRGSRPWDIRVHDERFFQRLLGQGTLGAHVGVRNGQPERLQPHTRQRKVDATGLDGMIGTWSGSNGI
jgi:hypothetical protein